MKINQITLIFLTSLFLVTFDNYSFFKNVTNIYPLTSDNFLFLISLVIILISFITMLFTILSSKYTTKPLLIIILLISSITNYFMNSYNIVIDECMIQNIVETNMNESLDLFNLKLIVYFIFLGVIPSIFIYKIKILYRPLKYEILSKIKTTIISLSIIAIMLLSFNKFYTSFFREHKPLRFYTNPTYYIYSAGKYINRNFLKKNSNQFICVTKKAEIKEADKEKKELIILVVGEAVRADRFSLNGYEKETNPLLKKENIINFSNIYSCGTSTAISVPCMFSIFDKDNFDNEKAKSTENILDILNKTKDIQILWRDNNSDSKGVALRVDYEDYKTPENNTICDIECRDEGMLIGLDEYIEKHKNRDILIVLHQMGNHGPAYYKRYPKEFEKFTPICETNQLEECSEKEISNAYDNAILYTDYFLSKSINFLKKYSNSYETALIYLSDHGESLGENGLYLHGMPYFIAPENQIHVPAIMWFGGAITEDINLTKLKSYSDKKFSQDNLFSTLLGLFEVETDVYKKDMDILHNARRNE